MKIILKLIFLYFSLWSRFLRFMFNKLVEVFGLLPCWKCWNDNKVEPAPVRKPVYIKIIEESVEKLPTILQALISEILKKILPDFLKDRLFPNKDDPIEVPVSTTEVILVPEKPKLPKPSELFWEFYKEKPWINDLYKSTSGSTFLNATEASLYLQEYYQTLKNHSLLIFHFERDHEMNGQLVHSGHLALDGTPIRFSPSFDYLCISLPLEQTNVFYESFDIDVFQSHQLKLIASPKGIDLDCRIGWKETVEVKVEEEPISEAEIKVESGLIDTDAKMCFDSMVTSTDSLESCTSSNLEFQKENRPGSFRKRKNRKKSNNSPAVEKEKVSNKI